MAVSVHANVADAQAVVTRKLTLYGEIPLIGLRIAVIGIDTLIEAPSAVLHAHRGRRGVGELDQWRAIRGHAVGISVQRGGRVAAVVKKERPQIGDGKDPEARADHRLRIVERTVGKREPRHLEGPGAASHGLESDDLEGSGRGSSSLLPHRQFAPLRSQGCR
jgi:hypothetical protein